MAYGADRRGDELQEWVTNKQHRLDKIRAAKAALEADARGKKRKADHHADRPRRGRPGKNPSGTPHDRAQRHFTDPDSRIMKAPDGFIQGDTAHLTVLACCHVRGYVATGRQQHGEASAVGIRKTVPRTRVHAMKIRLKRACFRSRYRLRKQVVEPVFGQIKQARASGSSCCGACRRSPVSGVWSAVPPHVLTLAGARG